MAKKDRDYFQGGQEAEGKVRKEAASASGKKASKKNATSF
jgi:hypothetical protein